MSQAEHYAGADWFRIIAAFLIVAIHTAPLSYYSEAMDFAFTHILARVAVPFFLMLTGYFVLSPWAEPEFHSRAALNKFFRKTAILYIIAILIYLPVNIYAGHFSEGNLLFNVFRALLFDGTLYHLWYLPASIIGAIIVYLLLRRFHLKAVMGVAALLYIIGLLGDSYYGVAIQIPALNGFYDAVFSFCTYTRNGLFYAPIFFALGVWIRRRDKSLKPSLSIIGFSISWLIMLSEGLILQHFGLQRHDSMYIALVPCMYFLFQFLLSFEGRAPAQLNRVAMWVYIIHPMMIIVVRGIARFTGSWELLVVNSLVHYILVCILSLLFALAVTAILQKLKKEDFSRGRAWVEIDLQNLRHNVKALNHMLADDAELMAVVKADAYGHGAVIIAKELNAMGIRSFAVASADEGVELRRRGVRGDILVLAYTHPRQFNLLKRYRLSQTVVDYQYARSLNDYGKKLKVHIKVDTGMHRLGERCENLDDIIKIFQCSNLRVEGLFSHLCTADSKRSEDIEFARQQTERFYQTVESLAERGIKPPKLHLQSSYGLINYPELKADYARVGIALYGAVNQAWCIGQPADLLPLLSLKARVALVKQVYKDEAVGYGLQYTAPQDARLAVISIGYADGIPRNLSCGGGSVLIAGAEAPIIGRICMDQLLVDVSHIPEVKPHDIAVLLGRSGEKEITVVQLSQQAGTIPNELLSRLGKRLKRVYFVRFHWRGRAMSRELSP